MKNSKNLKEVASLFFKMGWVAFGGPAAHIAMMEDEVVSKRKWMTREHFLDLVGATNLIPGPNSTEMALHCGYQRAGLAGLFAAGICFIFPAMLLTGILAWFYVEFGEVPALEQFLYGIKPAVLAIIIGALYKLGKKALKSWQLWVIAGLVVLGTFYMNEILSILSGGLIGMLWFGASGKSLKSVAPTSLLGLGLFTTKVTTGNIFFIFLKMGAVLFGSGYVLVAYLDGELVEKLGWLTKSELLDAIAIGQFTPGPVLTTATFVGFQLKGISGALAATAGIFLPSFLFVFLLNPLVPKLRKSKVSAAFLDGVNAGAMAVMLVVCVRLGIDVLIDWKAWLIFAGACLLHFQWKVAVYWIVIAGAATGYLLHLFF